VRKSLHLGTQLPPDIFSAILPCEQAGTKGANWQKVRGESCSAHDGGIAPSDTQTRLILRLKCMLRRERNNICIGCTYCALCLALGVHCAAALAKRNARTG